MTPKQQYYKNIADTMISNLKKRGFEADYVPDRQAAHMPSSEEAFTT